MTRRIDFSHFSSIKIGPVAEVEIVESREWKPDGHFIIGGASNLLLSPSPPKLAKLGGTFAYARQEGEVTVLGAAMPTGRVVSFLRKNDLGGLEFLAGLPGTVGGLLKMNAGMKEWETYTPLLWVRTTEGLFTKAQIPHGYRFADLPGVAFEAGFALTPGFDEEAVERFQTMRSNQPSDPSAGSFFKNPEGDYAGRLIEAVGLKGYQMGKMAFSPKHANFLVNLGGGTFEEAMELTGLARGKVYERFGIELEEEVIVL